MELPTNQDSTSRASKLIRKIELPWLILAALLLSTLLAAFQSSRQLRADTDARFAEIAQGEHRSLVRQLRDVENMLRTVKAFASALPTSSQATWEAYLAALVRDRGPQTGLVSIEFSRDASPRSAASMPNYITLVMPLDGNNANKKRGSAIAVIDVAAMVSELARNPDSLVLHELFAGQTRLFPSAEIARNEHTDAQLRAELPVEFGDRSFLLKISSTPQLEKTLKSDMPRTILVIGIFGTILLAALVLLLTRLRQQAETLAASMTKKLQDQTRFTEDLIEFNPNPIFRKDASGKFVAVNQAWEQLTGHNRSEILGKSSSELQAPDAFAESAMQDAMLLQSPSGYDAGEVTIKHTGGREFETIVAKKILKRADGTVDGLIGTITDVTLIKKLERELARQREQLDLVIRSSQQGIWDIDLLGGGAPYYSDRFREILGYSGSNFPKTFIWTNHVHPDDVAEVRRRVIAHLKGETSLFDIESRVKRADESYMWVRVRAIAPRNQAGRAVRFVGSISDVTDRKKAEVELVEANVRVTEAARAKEAFLATMSHEIRTPLNGVLGMTSLLSETNLNDEQHDYIRLIRSSGDTLLRLIDDVLDFSKIESGHMTLESVVVEIVPVVEEAFVLVAEKAREKDLALLFDMHDDVPFYLLGDATRLRQILLNLLSNAIKFTAAGEIKLTLASRQMTNGQLVLEGRVFDTGIGIPLDRASKLFQPFTQVDASTTRKYGGTGLGLAIVRRLTQLMGGDVAVESTEGVGSTFIFTVLTSVASGPQRPYMQCDVAAFLAKRLLVIDRNANRRKIQQHRYTRWGFDTVTTSEEDAVQKFAEGPPFDILLAEMEMSSTKALAMKDALEKDDLQRQRNGQALMAVILQSDISRAELLKQQINPIFRHDAFVLRPAGRGKIFDVFTRAVKHAPNLDFATRPYSLDRGHEAEYLTATSDRTAGSSTPSASAAAENRNSFPRLTIEGRPAKILVAEDNEVNQQVILGMLKNFGCKADLAHDGGSAVTQATSGRYDLILMDIHMPVLDGIAAMQKIRLLLAAKPCPPIVAMTAHALPGDRERYLAMGMDDYISKPLRIADLKNMFERIFLRDVHTQSAPVAAKPQTLPILDIEQLEDLCYLPGNQLGGEQHGAVGGLIRLYQTKANERILEMDRLLAGKEWSLLADIAHSLRGSSASMGFPRVAADCKDLELAARQKQNAKGEQLKTEAAMGEYLKRIKLNYQEAELALNQWLSDKANASSS